ncbi:MAG: chorismate mutase [Oscillospiraceae bacterium]|nr:chorismate mutase [Oscillospiraceae bacterium]
MTAKEELERLRGEIDGIDGRIVGLFNERMRVSEEIARAKERGNIAVTDLRREQDVIDAAAAASGDRNRAAAATLMRALISLSKKRQIEKLGLADAVSFPPSSSRKTDGVRAAFQGVEGAWGEHAAELLFPGAAFTGYDYFESVFEAVVANDADYGVLPIENSRTGAIGEVYDLLRRHSCYIVGQAWVAVKQCLLGQKGAVLSDIREVYSHPEGFGQCSRFLKNRNWELTACRNTAYAAKLAAERGGVKYAAIGSRRAAAAYGLEVVSPDIMDDAGNKTRFIAIAAEPLYDENCDTVSITFSTAHRSGALCAVLEAFMLTGINLSRIESRPVSADRYRFFADLQSNIMSGATRDALTLASMHCDYFEVLGCCGEIVE